MISIISDTICINEIFFYILISFALIGILFLLIGLFVFIGGRE